MSENQELLATIKSQIAELEKTKQSFLAGEPVEYRKGDLYVKKYTSIKDLDEGIRLLTAKAKKLEKRDSGLPFKVLGQIK